MPKCMIKNKQQKCQLNRVRRIEWGALMLCESSDSNRKKTYFLLPGNGLSIWKIMGSLLLLSFYCNFVLIMNKPFFFSPPGEITGSLFKSAIFYSGWIWSRYLGLLSKHKLQNPYLTISAIIYIWNLENFVSRICNKNKIVKTPIINNHHS